MTDGIKPVQTFNVRAVQYKTLPTHRGDVHQSGVDTETVCTVAAWFNLGDTLVFNLEVSTLKNRRSGTV